MTIFEAIKERHSVRQYTETPISAETEEKLRSVINECNGESGLNIQLILNDPECFNTFLAHYGKFKNANNYLALVGSTSLADLDERAGYYGQRIVLEAQKLGLNTCWVAGTYGRGKCKADISKGEKIVCVIAIGYGVNSGTPHRSKPMDKLCDVAKDDMPSWFKNGVVAALMAPTALNQQKFHITLDGENGVITSKRGPMTRIDLGIVRYNFEAASGHKCVTGAREK
ncbi:MAG: nitroreductase family protein [Ruminococcus sp.]|nr:nitroreductase family protein [Ruminococcus sp.]